MIPPRMNSGSTYRKLCRGVNEFVTKYGEKPIQADYEPQREHKRCPSTLLRLHEHGKGWKQQVEQEYHAQEPRYADYGDSIVGQEAMQKHPFHRRLINGVWRALHEDVNHQEQTEERQDLAIAPFVEAFEVNLAALEAA